METTHHGCGPVQLCIPWLDFPLSAIPPQNRGIKRYTLEDTWNISLKNKKVLICIGEHIRFGEKEKNSLENFVNVTIVQFIQITCLTTMENILSRETFYLRQLELKIQDGNLFQIF